MSCKPPGAREAAPKSRRAPHHQVAKTSPWRRSGISSHFHDCEKGPYSTDAALLYPEFKQVIKIQNMGSRYTTTCPSTGQRLGAAFLTKQDVEGNDLRHRSCKMASCLHLLVASLQLRHPNLCVGGFSAGTWHSRGRDIAPASKRYVAWHSSPGTVCLTLPTRRGPSAK